MLKVIIYNFPMKTKRARNLRTRQTNAEAKLWARLRNRQLGGLKFRRQVPLGPYIADVVCHEAKLIVELDGSQHAEQIGYDKNRTKYFEAHGYQVLRFWNPDVLQNIDGVLVGIDLAARAYLLSKKNETE